MGLEEVDLDLQHLSKGFKAVQTLAKGDLFPVVISKADVAEDDSSQLRQIVLGDILIEDGELGEGREKLGTLKLIQFVTELVFRSVQVLHQLQLGDGCPHQYLHY